MSETDVLGRIAAHTRKRLEKLKAERPVEALRQSELYGRQPRDFAAAFAAKGPRVIAEVKFASPSEGFLRPQSLATADEAARLAGGYIKGGAAAISVLTERNFFGGAPEFLGTVRRAHNGAPLLMKDFMVDDYQFELARAQGADCILLIAALLGDGLAGMLKKAQTLGLSALVEVHDEAELKLAVAAECRLIGVNSRNLRTLKTDLGVARALAGKAPGAVMIAESGLKTRADLDELSALGYQGFLIGSSLMKQPDPGEALRSLIA